MRASHIIAGAGLYLAVAGSTYTWMKGKQSVAKDAQKQQQAGADADAASLLGERGPAAAAAATARRFDSLSRCYDDTVGSEERWMLYGLLRSSLLRSAKGKVLEIGAGTGRNLPHLPLAAVDELTFVDSSADMLRVAERKYFDEQRLGYKHPHVKARFCLGDAEDLVAGPGEVAQAPPLPAVRGGKEQEDKEADEAPSSSSSSSSSSNSGFSRLWRAPPSAASSGAKRRQDEEEEEEEEPEAPPPPPPPRSQQRQPPRPAPQQHPPATDQQEQQIKAKFPPGSFDVVVDTFGLCSVEDPVRVLRQAARLVKPTTGRILLLEHGRPPKGTLGHWLLSERMDAAAPEHKKRWGCWFNRDIAAVVEESGLRIVSESRWHFGTTYVYELAPPVDDEAAEGVGGGGVTSSGGGGGGSAGTAARGAAATAPAPAAK